jgi:glutathionylspermidine synthase
VHRILQRYLRFNVNRYAVLHFVTDEVEKDIHYTFLRDFLSKAGFIDEADFKLSENVYK